MKSLLIIFIVLSLNAHSEMIKRTKVLMGTFVSISLESSDKQHLTPSFDILKNIEKSLSSYDTQATIYKLNKYKKVKSDFYTFDALSLSKEYYRITDGYFNVAVGSITKELYRFGEKESVPSSRSLREAQVAFEKLYFDEHIIKIADDIKIDLGGMGKGYGVDNVVAYLTRVGVQKARVALSGDIRCIGECSVEINNPFSSSALVAFKIRDMGVSTSGNYNRFVQTPQNNHLINPKTKKSAQNFISITLISKLPNSDLDAFATASSVMPQKMAFEFLDSLPLAYVVLLKNKELVVSENIDLFVDDARKE